MFYTMFYARETAQYIVYENGSGHAKSYPFPVYVPKTDQKPPQTITVTIAAA